MAEINQTVVEAATNAMEPGAQLRAAREALGYTLEQASRHLHLDMQTIASIESDQYPAHIPATYLRGYLRAYAKWLDMPADAIVASFKTANDGDSNLSGLQSLSSLPAGSTNAAKRLGFMVVVGVALVVVAGALYLFVPQILSKVESVFSASDENSLESQTPQALNSKEGELSLNLAPVSSNPSEAEGSSELAIDGNPASSLDNANPGVLANANKPGASSTISPTTSNTKPASASTTPSKNINDGIEVSESTHALPGTSEVLQLTFNGDCWVRITDANGEVLAIGTKPLGHRMRLSGPAPLSVVLGNPSVVELQHNGRPVDLSRYPGGSPASLTINAPVSE